WSPAMNAACSSTPRVPFRGCPGACAATCTGRQNGSPPTSTTLRPPGPACHALTHVIAYDISDDHRRARVAAALQAYGDRIQGRHLRKSAASVNSDFVAFVPGGQLRVSSEPCNRTSSRLVTGPPKEVGFQPKSRRQAYRNHSQSVIQLPLTRSSQSHAARRIE